MRASQASAIMKAVALWANHRDDIRALAVLGAWARGDAAPGSDLDLLCLTDSAANYRLDEAWLDEIDFGQAGYDLHLSRAADYGAVCSWHLLLHPPAELELSFARCDWASTTPMDARTRRVIGDGMQILFDKDGLLSRAAAAIVKPEIQEPGIRELASQEPPSQEPGLQETATPKPASPKPGTPEPIGQSPGRQGMMRAIEHHDAFTWPDADATDSITLDFDNRHRRRIRLTTDRGVPVLLDLPKAVAMAHGDGLRLDGGGWLRINAAPEGLVEVRADDATQLARIAWHIGNRHFPAQIMDGAIRIRPDHVIEAMIVGLGGALTRMDAPFQPEGGAYGGQAMHGQPHAHPHGHDQGDGQGHAHDHGHGHAHGHRHDHGHGHVHGHGHAHGAEHHHGGEGHHHGTGQGHSHDHDHDHDHSHHLAHARGHHSHSHDG